MDDFYNRLSAEAATIDELLSDDFEPLPGQKSDAEKAGARLGAWCRTAASGDWSLFERRLVRDGLSISGVLTRFATVRRRAASPVPAWVTDAMWIEAALSQPARAADLTPGSRPSSTQPFAFEDALLPVVDRASAILLDGCDEAKEVLAESALAGLRGSLLESLSELVAPALYELFAAVRTQPRSSADPKVRPASAGYDRFIADMRNGGFRRLFGDKPVLLRLIAVVARQWIETSRELAIRLSADLATIRRVLLRSDRTCRASHIRDNLSDPHNLGRTVKIVSFGDGMKVVYKPKDLALEVAWHALVERFNRSGAPTDLRPAATIARDGYGWAEHIAHAGCDRPDDLPMFFRRSGAWLALLHCFAGTDMHHENIVAAGGHPVPIDLEMLLQPSPEMHPSHDAEDQALAEAMDIVADSVVAVGLLPAYARSPDRNIVSVGGIAAQRGPKPTLAWEQPNSDDMRPVRIDQSDGVTPNLPHLGGQYAAFGDHVDDFVQGFAQYAQFIAEQVRLSGRRALLDGFSGVPVRKVIRPTRFYDMLLRRLKDHRTMTDGIRWSAQADFAARLGDWDVNDDPLWPLQRAERAALTELSVPHFTSPSDGAAIRDAAGVVLQTVAKPGIDRARSRLDRLNEQAIAAECEIIRQTTTMVSRSVSPAPRRHDPVLPEADAPPPSDEILIAQADAAADALNRHAIRRAGSAAWVGLDWLGDSEVSQLVALGVDLYNGTAGIALFLAAHATVTRRDGSEALARAALAHICKTLRGPGAARLGRVIGLGAGTGLGSVIYALTCVARFLGDERYLDDARAAARLFTDDLIAADRQLDALGGTAGGILALLRLHRACPDRDILDRAEACGQHLLAQPRVRVGEHRSWAVQGAGPNPLNGLSHGAAGFALALASLASATRNDQFAAAAAECLAFENASYDAERRNWPDLRHRDTPRWHWKWCHGAYGIGLARIAVARATPGAAPALERDIRAAVEGADAGWPGRDDTLCCGALGHIEFLCEAGTHLDRPDLRALGATRMMQLAASAGRAGSYRWNGGIERFNLGLFRGIAGVGYSALRQVDGALPNVLIWD
jgi:type 2 lantibiotic biosynthesis protein LanM